MFAVEAGAHGSRISEAAAQGRHNASALRSFYIPRVARRRSKSRVGIALACCLPFGWVALVGAGSVLHV